MLIPYVKAIVLAIETVETETKKNIVLTIRSYKAYHFCLI